MTNKEVMEIFKEMELAIIKLMQELNIITAEAGNYMASQAQLPNQLNNPNILSGMQPGTNPLELLQMQQRQQLDQMKKGKQEWLWFILTIISFTYYTMYHHWAIVVFQTLMLLGLSSPFIYIVNDKILS